MGYHLILKNEDGSIKYEYCDEFYKLAYFPIEDNSIIYEVESHWTPFLVKDNEYYQNLSDLHFSSLIKVEWLFMRQVKEHKDMIELIDQDSKSFSQYYDVSDDFLKIKRRDFLIRNVGNLEIEAKCKIIYIYWDKRKPYFYFEKEHLEKHLKMQEFTKTPVIMALYERDSKDEESPCSRKITYDGYGLYAEYY